MAGLDWRIITSAGKAITTALPGGGKPNPACASFTPRPATNDPENGQSVGSVITFGKFRTIDLGDLLWDNEKDFMCPNNLVGTVDLYIASHHGIDASGSPALVHGLQPRVAIEQNGTRKGGTVQTNRTLYSSPGFEDVWQMHWSYNVGTEYNPAGLFIANIDEPAVVAAVLTAPPVEAVAGLADPGGGAPPAPGAAPASVACRRNAPPQPPLRRQRPPAAAPVQPPAAAAQAPSAGPTGQPGVAPPAGAPGGRQVAADAAAPAPRTPGRRS